MINFSPSRLSFCILYELRRLVGSEMKFLILCWMACDSVGLANFVRSPVPHLRFRRCLFKGKAERGKA
jgi:hypothetical protein